MELLARGWIDGGVDREPPRELGEVSQTRGEGKVLEEGVVDVADTRGATRVGTRVGTRIGTLPPRRCGLPRAPAASPPSRRLATLTFDASTNSAPRRALSMSSLALRVAWLTPPVQPHE